MKNIPVHDRPREKLVSLGPGRLGDSELLAIILSSGNKGKSVLDLSSQILSKYDFVKLSSMNPSQLKQEFGIGIAKACQISSCFEIGRRTAQFRLREKPKITSASDVAALFGPSMEGLSTEHFKGVYLNARRKVICEKTLFVGTLNESVVHAREIFKTAFEEGAAAIILLHNHPSGDPSPSAADIAITKELIAAGKILGIAVLDHVIIGRNGFWSIAENGLSFE